MQYAGSKRVPVPPIRIIRSRAPTHAYAPFLRTPLGCAAANARRRTRRRSASVRRGTPEPRSTASRKRRCCATCGNVFHAALAQPVLARRVLLPRRAVRETVPAVEGPREGHQADVGHDSIVAAVPNEEVQERDVILRLTLASNVE